MSRPDLWARGPHSCFFRESLAAPTALLKVFLFDFFIEVRLTEHNDPFLSVHFVGI